MLIIGRDDVRRYLTMDVCIPLIRDAMIALSAGHTTQLLRQIIPLHSGKAAFGVMPGVLAHEQAQTFGAKLIAVFPGNAAEGLQSHQGVVVIFNPENGTPLAVVHAGEITGIRTAAASAVATDALASNDAKRLAILGAGEQALAHIEAIAMVRKLESIKVWGRTQHRAESLARLASERLHLPVTAVSSVEESMADADIVCTTTAAREPIVEGRWAKPGTHFNVVGSSYAGPAEITSDLVAMSRFFVDQREAAQRQAAELIHARDAGLVGDDHIAGEIGEVLAGKSPGRRTVDEITIYKSLGNIVQDLASAFFLYGKAMEQGFGTEAPF